MAFTVRDIVMNADLFRAAYPNWPRPEPAPPAVTIGGRLYGLDDAVAASAVLAELDAGRDQAAARLAVMARLDALDRNGLEALCAVFGVEVYPLDTMRGG
jgi:hypothetical protein